jgi:hypothetical protein
MSDHLKISGAVLEQADAALRNAACSFASAGWVSAGADYGAGQVSAAVSGFVAALMRATEGSGDSVASQAQGARTTRAGFVQLDSQIASSASFVAGS